MTLTTIPITTPLLGAPHDGQRLLVLLRVEVIYATTQVRASQDFRFRCRNCGAHLHEWTTTHYRRRDFVRHN
jgi:hypothetical protein